MFKTSNAAPLNSICLDNLISVFFTKVIKLPSKMCLTCHEIHKKRPFIGLFGIFQNASYAKKENYLLLTFSCLSVCL